jgi:hypothetical protein
MVPHDPRVGLEPPREQRAPGAGSAILGASITRTVDGALMGAAAGVLLGTLGFGYALWRTYEPQIRNRRLAA